MRTAVVLILFRRPDRTARVFERIREARPSRLFLIADGPRPGEEQEARDCERARAVVESVDWPCEVVRDFSDENLGLKRRIPSGLDRVFEESTEAIILEDDCLPHPSFFRYVHIWGWATWRRAWQRFDVDLTDWHATPNAEREARLRRMFDADDERRYWGWAWDHSDEIDNWDHQWAFTCLSRGLLAANPNRNLISNIGFGEEATNATADPHGLAGRPLEGISFPLDHPTEVRRDLAADASASRLFRRPVPTLRQRSV